MVKSGKLRSGTAQKLKRWKKGHSSDSNPETRRYRQAARSRFFSRPSENSDLTVDALKLHNELQVGALGRQEGGSDRACSAEGPVLSERTSGTFLSGLSDCSNVTFSKVQRFWESNSAAHKEICAVLAAVTEVIRAQGGKETETEYFAALMTTLETVESSESVGAVAYLLNLVLKRVPSPVLIKKFSDTSKVFMSIMSTHASKESPSALRWVVSCLATLLRKQDLSVWSYPSTVQVYHGLLSFCVHSKPKVRKAAQHGVCSVLKGSDFMFSESAPAYHPAALSTAKFCIKEMEEAGGSKEDTTTLHVLGFLKDLLPCFPLSAVKSCCETLLRVMTLSHVLVTAGAMQAFHKLFSAKPNPTTLSAELNAQIITALYDYLPSENDLQPLLAWLAVMEKAHTHLSSLQSSLCLGHLPRLFSTAMSCFLSPHSQVVSTAAQTLKALLSECVAPCMADVGSVSSTAATGQALYVCKMLHAVEEGLTYRFHSSWPFVLQVLGSFYKVAGKQAHPIMMKSLQSLCDLRATPHFPFSGELDLAVGAAVESMGPEVILRAVPLQMGGKQVMFFFLILQSCLKKKRALAWVACQQKNENLHVLPSVQSRPSVGVCVLITGRIAALGCSSFPFVVPSVCQVPALPSYLLLINSPVFCLKALSYVRLLYPVKPDDLEFPRSWLIPVIRDHVKNTELAFFNSYFLPLAATFKQRADELDQAGRKLESRVYQTLQLQIWTMLPGFCTHTTDLTSSFKGIARTLGMAISERPDLRPTICQALRTLINKSCEKEEDRAEVGRFAKNFLPILFNVYSQQPVAGESTPLRMPMLDTIKVYLTITDQQLVCTFLQKAVEKLNTPECTEFTRLSVMDLIVVMAPCVDEATMSQTYEIIRPCLESKDPGVQKKAYRVLEEMCGGERESCRRFVLTNLEQLKQTLLGSLKSASSPAKRPRLKCLIHVVKQLNLEHGDFITALLPEVIICTKEVAYTLLVEIGQAYIRFCDSANEAMEQYLGMVYAGLTGSVTMIACTVLALTRLVFEFKDYMDVSVMEQLLQNVCLLLSSRTREVVKAALGFIKVILFIMDPKVLAGHVTVMMEGIGNIKDDVRRHFRNKLKNIFTKFIRKFGFELVKSMVPEEHQKVLGNIRKTEARNKRRKLLQQADKAGSESEEETPKVKGDSIEEILADSESEDEDTKPERGGKKGLRKKGRAWLKEGESDEPLNFLDPQVSQRVLATNPDVKKSLKVQHGFKVTSDGRLIIREDRDEDKEVKGENKEMDDVLEEAGVKSKKAQKRKFQRDDFDEDMELEPQLQYKAGGSGIHRPLSGKEEFGKEYKSKSGKGDVKKKGKHDPYTYIPLRKAQLNRRKKAKLQGQFKGLVRGARKGAQSGKRMQRSKRKA
ncbi:RRP12 protein, partial [Atractosteus spatula]|nr:RRP12 protein [Atractosteus spatula]